MKIKKILNIKLLSFLFIFLTILSAYFKSRTLKPWNDEIVSLVSNLNFFYNNLNFIGPYKTEYFISYSPTLTAGPLSAIGGIFSWFFTDNIYLIRVANLIYLLVLAIIFSFLVFKKLNFKIDINFLVLVVIIIFSLNNTSWWYSILYLLPETLCAVIFASSVLLFKKNRNAALFLMSFSVFFGDFLTVVLFSGFYIATIIYERSIQNVIKDSLYIFLPLIFWLILVKFFSDYSIYQYLIDYYMHYFEHKSAGEISFSLNSIVNNFRSSEVYFWSTTDFLRVLIAPILFSFLIIKSSTFEETISKFQILLPLIFLYGWFWLLSPAKSIIYSGLFTTYVLILNAYYLIITRDLDRLGLYISLTIFSFFFSSKIILIFYLIIFAWIVMRKNTTFTKNLFFKAIIIFMILNQINVLGETIKLEIYQINLKSCKQSLESNLCLNNYYGN